MSLYEPTSIQSSYAAMSALNNNFDEISDLFESVMFRDGRNPVGMTAPLDLNANRLVNVADGVANSDGVNLRQLMDAIGSVASYDNPTVPLLNRLALSEFDDTTLPVVLSEQNVEGIFTYDSSDLSAEVTSDPNEALYVAPVTDPTGASGAWVRRYEGPINVKWFGAQGNGTGNDTAAIQAACDIGGQVYIPTGVYILTAPINLTVAGTRVEGAGKVAIYQNTLNAKIFNVTANECSISHVTLDYNGVPTAGATAIYCSGANPEFHSFKINRCDKGVFFEGTIIGYLHDFKIYNFNQAGIHIKGCGDIIVDGFVLDATTSAQGTLGAVYLENFCEAVVVSNGDILNAVYSLQTTAATTTPGLVPAHNRFSNIYFDSAAQGVLLHRAFTTEFIGCWFSGGRTGAGYPGVKLNTTESISFTACQFVNNGGHGAQLTSAADRTKFVNCNFLGNSVTAGANVSDGLAIDGGTNNVIVSNCIARNTYFAGTQRYGVSVGNACNNLLIKDCILNGNGTGSFSPGTGHSGCIFKDLIGYNPVGGSAITVGASPYTYTAGPTPETVYVIAGTVSQIVVAGTVVGLSTDQTISLSPNQSVQVTYSSLPYMNKIVH